MSTGETGPGAMVIQEADTIRVTADVLSIPDEIAVPLDGREIGSQIHAGDIALPEGVTLADDAELLVFNFVAQSGSVTETPDTETEAEATEDSE